MSCPLCDSRKAKRACPALGRTICAVCCGTKRLSEISCPPTCSYLSTARIHPPAVVQRRQERDVRFLLSIVPELDDRQVQLLIFLQEVILTHAGSAVPPLLDEEVAAAADALASTLETARKGIIYDHQPSSLPAQRLVSSLQEALTELLGRAGSQASAVERDAAVVLRRIARAAGEAPRALPGEEPPVFLKLLVRLRSQRAAGESEGTAPADTDPAARLIIPG